MKTLEIKEQLKPFRPFFLHLDSGYSCYIPHPDFLFFPPAIAGEIIIVVGQNGATHVIDIEHVNRIEFTESKVL
jgi:hypothetical protein